MPPIKKALYLLLVAVGLGAAIVFYLGSKKYQFPVRESIQAPPQVVFDHLVDPDLIKQWSKGTVEIKLIEGDLSTEESTLERVVDTGGQEVEFTELIRSVKPNERLLIDGECQQYSISRDFRLEQTGERTNLRYVIEYQYRGLYRFLAPFIPHPQRELAEGDALRLRQLAEQNYDDRGRVNF